MDSIFLLIDTFVICVAFGINTLTRKMDHQDQSRQDHCDLTPFHFRSIKFE